jgi:hypothetical protein
MGRLQNNPSIGWVHPKSTHAHPLAWGNNYHDMSIMGKKWENILCKYSMLGNAIPKMKCMPEAKPPRGTSFGNTSLLGHYYPTPNSDPYIYVTYIPKGRIKANRQGPAR